MDVEKNKEMLEDVPYINLENLAVVYRVMAPRVEGVKGKTDYMESKEILEMVKEANANGVLTEDEILSDSVYRYDESGLKLI